MSDKKDQRFRYRVIEHPDEGDVDTDTFYDLVADEVDPATMDEIDHRVLAEQAAEDFFCEHDGWECEWPMVIILFNGEQEFARYRVDMEAVPEFMVVRKEA